MYNLIVDRGRALLKGNLWELRDIEFKIQKRKRFEKREYHKNITRKELDSRDLYMGIRKIKTEFQPTTYHFKYEGKIINLNERAEFAANYLQNVQ